MPNAFPQFVTAVSAQPNLLRWMTHIWQRLHTHQRLGLILGAGVSVEAGCPLWPKLVGDLARRARVPAKLLTAHRKSGLQEAFLAQMLYQKYGDKVLAKNSFVPPRFAPFQRESAWMEVVHSALYKKLSGLKFEDIEKRHPYLCALGELVARSPFTVNFNFDDIVDEAAIRHISKESAGGKQKLPLPDVIWRPKVENRRNATTIYHINGLLPREAGRRRSDFLTLTEEAFADILIAPNSNDAEFVASRFANTTFLILGTSLSDNSLKNMLRAGARRNPANHHYIVYWENPLKPRAAEQRKDIFSANLEVYNLISIFLSTEEILSFIAILNHNDENKFETCMADLGSSGTRFKYHLVGAVSSGKTTNLELLRCFETSEEWLDRPPAAMYRSHKSLSMAEREHIDAWLCDQMRGKNDLMRQSGPGAHIMDRAYLDPLAFSNSPTEVLAKLDNLKKRVTNFGNLQPAQVFFLEASSQDFEKRLANRGNLRGRNRTLFYEPDELLAQSRTLKAIYNPPKETVIDTTSSPGETARRIARQILLEDYKPIDFDRRIEYIRGSSGVL